MKRKTTLFVCGVMLALSVTSPINTYAKDFTSSDEAGFTSEDMTISEEKTVGIESDVTAGTVEENRQPEENTDLEESVSTGKQDPDAQGFLGTEDEGNPVTFEKEENTENLVFFGDTELLDDGEVAAVGASGTGFDSAKTMYTNTMYSTNLTDSIRERWLKFTVTGDGYISVDFSHEYLESGETYWWATIYTDGSHKQLASYGFAGNNVSYSQQKFGISAGTYYLLRLPTPKMGFAP